MSCIDLNTNQTVVSLLDSICEKFPDSIALVCGEKQLTYRELYQKTEQLYTYLTYSGQLKPNSLIGLCIEAGFEMVIAIYTILKAGAAFVPIDPDLPCQRISYMIKDAGVTSILTSYKFIFDIGPAIRQSGQYIQMCFLDSPELWNSLELPLTKTVSPEFPELNSEQLAYIIYTSGSTGTPKGVMIAHRGLLNHTLASCDIYNAKQKNLKVLQFASLSFDSAMAEIMIPLCSGGTLILGSREELLPGEPLANFLIQYEVDMVIFSPSVLATLTQFKEQLSHLKIIIVGGEACPLSLAKIWVDEDTRFFNVYGPTEITIYGTMYNFNTEDTSVPIGYALPNVEVYVLDDDMKLCTRGEKGELYVGGVGVAKGYWNKSDLTRTHFLDNPYGSGKIYKTGDIVYEDPQHPGLLYFVGRADNQIKIRGHRVELEAIERVLTQHADILAAAVKAIRTASASKISEKISEKILEKILEKISDFPDNYGWNMLVAYVVARPGKFITENHIWNLLREELPSYMIPARLVFLDELPLMPNRSKVDRKALPDLPQPSYVGVSSTEIAVKIAAIFDEALQLPPFTCEPGSNFFYMGGTSLCVAYVLRAIERNFGVSVPSRLIYEYPTPSHLALVLGQLSQTRDVVVDEHLDLLAEAQLPTNIDTSIWQTPPQDKYGCALITGVTGYLGTHLLYELLRKQKYKKIYCLIRAKNDTEAWERLCKALTQYQLPTNQLWQVQAIAGDIQETYLQLPTATYNMLADDVDVIYHVAADTNFIKPYSTIKKTNVDGTANLIAFAAHRRHKALHYTSSLIIYGAAATLLGFDELSEDFDINCSLPIMSVEFGYVKAKWVAERMLYSAREMGLAVSIYRPGFISGHSQIPGIANFNDMFYRYISSCLQMGMYPDFSEKYWDPVPVDFVAEVIAHISMSGDNIGKNYNVLIPREYEIPIGEVFEVIADLGYPLQKMSPKNWLNALAAIEPKNPLHPLNSFLREKVYQNRSTILEVHERTPAFRMDNTFKAIAGSGIKCPKMDKALIRHYLPDFVRDVSKPCVSTTLSLPI
ncbi:MAG: amino acid adenylation domain-containing protein [Scytonematopsis contorta HA4267-MV1]|jgi:amino acid adenylation domain-containing protein/thioester reductase-like protein|nr:amino acid adenylation domain-containing protein [Scytonematopsis contorta HA4267-MV1]